MNFAVDLMMMKSMNKNDGKALSTIYDIDGENLFCLNGEVAVKYYESINFLKDNNKEPTLENVKRVFDIFLKEYDPFFRLLCSKKYIEHIEKLKKKRLMQVAMESVGFVYMAYQIFNSMKKLNSTSKFKYIPLIAIVLYVAINLFNAYYTNYTKKEYNIVKTLRVRLNDISGNVYLQIPEIGKINSKTSSLFYEMLKNKSETILKYVDNPTSVNKMAIQNKVNTEISSQTQLTNKTNTDSDNEIGIELSKLEEIEKQLVPELFPQETIMIEIDDKSVENTNKEEIINIENIQDIKLEDDKLSATEELLEEIKEEIKQEEEQEKINNNNKKQELIQVDELVEVKEQPKRKGRQPTKPKTTTKQTKTTKSKQTKSKQKK